MTPPRGRQARLKAEHAYLYPGIDATAWMPVETLIHRVVTLLYGDPAKSGVITGERLLTGRPLRVPRPVVAAERLARLPEPHERRRRQAAREGMTERDATMSVARANLLRDRLAPGLRSSHRSAPSPSSGAPTASTPHSPPRRISASPFRSWPSASFCTRDCTPSDFASSAAHRGRRSASGSSAARSRRTPTAPHRSGPTPIAPRRSCPARCSACGPVLAAWLSGAGIPVLYGWAMLAVAGGDLAAVWAIRDVPGEVLVLDHPQRVGCRIMEQPAA